MSTRLYRVTISGFVSDDNTEQNLIAKTKKYLLSSSIGPSLVHEFAVNNARFYFGAKVKFIFVENLDKIEPNSLLASTPITPLLSLICVDESTIDNY